MSAVGRSWPRAGLCSCPGGVCLLALSARCLWERALSLPVVDRDSRNGICVSSRAPFQNQTFVCFLDCPPNLDSLSLFVLMDESVSPTHLACSSSLSREHRKIDFCLCMCLGVNFFLCFSVSNIGPGWTSTWDHNECVWAVTWGVLSSTVCDVPEFQGRLQFSNPRLRGTGEITCLEPVLSYLSMFHSCKLEIFPQQNRLLTICSGNVAVGV